MSRGLLGMALASMIPLGAAALDYPTRPGTAPNQITISCFRGLVDAVVWDRPNAVFVDDLVRIGYEYPQAYAIAQTVCRDEYGVNNPGYMTQRLQQLMATTPVTR
ncbi:hypothetical protein ATO3_19995 [Marinibacterium profundimaris]|uniref:Uncharacterized protein n=2 Tax=Marinibacterium profundimaris TaxID=1679460 RepID=A0A225NE50_9RHOB|nr:hypothetical protein ATO3_19995 [Marinibacterium profundimaris]